MLVEQLAHLPMFRMVPRQDLEVFASTTQSVDIPTGVTVFEGDSMPDDAALLVLEGMLEAILPADPHHPLGYIRPGEVAGELALFTVTHHRRVTVRATEPSRAVLLTEETLERCGDNLAVVQLERYLLSSLARRIRGDNLRVKQEWKELEVDEPDSSPSNLRSWLSNLFGGGS